MNRNRLLVLFLLPLMLLIAGCKDVKEEEVPEHNNFLWEVKSEQGRVYLLGSIHMAKEELYPLNIVIERRFRDSDYLVVEADVTGANLNKAMKLMQERGFYPKGESIEDHLPGELLEALKRELAASGLNLQQLKSMKPWALALTLTNMKMQRNGYSAMSGIDIHFLKKAQANDKPYKELESVEMQLGMLTSMTPEQELLFLESVLSDSAVGTKEWAARLFELWKVGDYSGLEELIIKPFEENPRLQPFYELYFTQRNYGMLEKIEGYLEDDKSYFVVVGAGHLVGEEGLLELLKAKGYSINQL